MPNIIYGIFMKDFNEYFLINNKSGYKSNERWLSINNPHLYSLIINNSTRTDISFIEKIFLFLNNLNDVPKCPNCNNYVKFNGTLKKGYNKYCSISCLNKSKEHKEKIISTSLIKYGCQSPNQADIVKTKKKNSLNINYGVDNPMKSEKIKNKQINSLIINYGVDNPMKIDEIINKRKKDIENGTEFNIKRMLDRIDNKIIKYIRHDCNGNVHFECKICNNNFEINSNLLTSRLANNTTICTNCNKNKSFSEIQKSIEEFLTSMNVKYESKNRKLLNGKEIDIYIPDYKLGIEIDGLFWHSNKFKKNNYHLNKTEECEKQGIQLLHIFEDEWIYKQDIVKSIIKSKLNIIENKIFGRKCIIKKVNNKLCSDFLNKNHLQGNVGSGVKLGLYYDDELISVMTFGRKRISMGNKINVDGEYEMHRFCNKTNYKIHGGASKLLNYFIKTYQPKSILTFADRRYSNGNLYKQLGFQFQYKTKPNYFYILPGEIKKHYRFKFRKNVLVKEGYDSLKTEFQIMNERGYLQIYDCGSIKFIYNG
jgi:G:T-mismatch repair DNA endonuclease (very short patch repair protein)